jgi:hypothetical protein
MPYESLLPCRTLYRIRIFYSLNCTSFNKDKEMDGVEEDAINNIKTLCRRTDIITRLKY